MWRSDRTGKADMLSAFTESLTDSLKLIPFLFVTYLVMGMLERAASEKAQHAIMEAGKIGPIWGGLLGAIPQCGFSAAASYFYVGKVITLGTLISIYLSTSDEMLPIFISEKVAVSTIVSILATKVIIGMVSGFIVEFVLGWLAKRRKVPKDFDMEPDRGCNCAASLLMDSIMRTLKVFFFIFLVSLAINLVMTAVGQEGISMLFKDLPVVGEMIAALIGLIPNCAASVVITQLYLEGVISAGPMMSGLLASAGVGLLVLFREDKHKKQCFMVVAVLYVVSVAWGVAIEIFGITF